MNESRNTFNSIAGRPLLMKSFWCNFGFHKWQKWSEVKRTIRPGFDHLTHNIQERYCEACNYYVYRVIKDKSNGY